MKTNIIHYRILVFQQETNAIKRTHYLGIEAKDYRIDELIKKECKIKDNEYYTLSIVSQAEFMESFVQQQSTEFQFSEDCSKAFLIFLGFALIIVSLFFLLIRC